MLPQGLQASPPEALEQKGKGWALDLMPQVQEAASEQRVRVEDCSRHGWLMAAVTE